MLPRVLRSWLLIVGLCLLAPPAAKAADASTAEWRIQITQGAAGQDPVIKIDLLVNGRQTVAVVPAATTGGAAVIPPSQYAARDIPARALCACYSYAANSGESYYVVAAGKDRLALYRRTWDEDGTTRYKKVRAIRVEAR